VDGDAEEGGLERSERVGAGKEVDDEPPIRSWQRASPDGGHEPRANDGRLPRSGWADDGEEPGSRHTLPEPLHQPLGHRLAAEEVPRVGLQEGSQTLVGVPGLGDKLSDRSRSLESFVERGGGLEHVGEALARVLGGRPCDRIVDGRPELGPHLADRWQRLVEMPVEQLGERGCSPVSIS